MSIVSTTILTALLAAAVVEAIAFRILKDEKSNWFRRLFRRTQAE
jgi:hypothetical protein